MFIDICVKIVGKNLPQIGPNEFFAISFHILPYSHHFMHSQVVCFEKLCSIPTSYNIFSEKSKANEKEAISIHIILASFELINTQHDQILYHWVRQKTIHTFSVRVFGSFDKKWLKFRESLQIQIKILLIIQKCFWDIRCQFLYEVLIQNLQGCQKITFETRICSANSEVDQNYEPQLWFRVYETITHKNWVITRY